MTASELATFLREEVSRIKKHAVEFPWKDASREDEEQLLSALDAAVGLLKEAYDALNLVHPQTADGCVIDNTLATLRLVVGEE